MLNEELSQLIELEIPRLRRYAMFLARDPEKADDLVQECLVRAIDNIDKFQPGTNIRSWLMTILHNNFVNETKKRRPLLTQDGVIERATPIEGGQEARHQMRDVQRAFEAAELAASPDHLVHLRRADGLQRGCAPARRSGRDCALAPVPRARASEAADGAGERNREWRRGGRGGTEERRSSPVPAAAARSATRCGERGRGDRTGA